MPSEAVTTHDVSRARFLLEQVAAVLRVEHAKQAVNRKAVLRPDREQYAVIVGRRLQFKIKAAAKALPQREPPSLVDPSAERRMNHKLHPARIIEKALEDDFLAGRNRADGGFLSRDVAHGLLGRILGTTEFSL